MRLRYALHHAAFVLVGVGGWMTLFVVGLRV